MEKHKRQSSETIDVRLLQEMTLAAQAFRRARGANRVAAMQRYVTALHRFNDQALRRLGAGS